MAYLQAKQKIAQPALIVQAETMALDGDEVGIALFAKPRVGRLVEGHQIPALRELIGEVVAPADRLPVGQAPGKAHRHPRPPVALPLTGSIDREALQPHRAHVVELPPAVRVGGVGVVAPKPHGGK